MGSAGQILCHGPELGARRLAAYRTDRVGGGDDHAVDHAVDTARWVDSLEGWGPHERRDNLRDKRGWGVRSMARSGSRQPCAEASL